MEPDPTRGPSRNGLLAGAGLGLVQPADPVAVPGTAGRGVSTDAPRQLADRVRARNAARDTRQVEALTARARSHPARPAPVFRGTAGAAVRALDDAVASRRPGLGAPDSLTKPLTAAAASQRHRAVGDRSLKATEPDAIGIDAGPGHRHVSLRTTAGGPTLGPDDRPEGSTSR